MSTEIIYNTYDNEASIVHDDIVNDKVLKVVTVPFGNSNTKDVLEYPLAENLLEVQSYGFSQFIKVSFLVRKAEVILHIDNEDIVVAEVENIEMNHWYRLEGFFTMDELKKVEFSSATLRLRITKAFNDPEIYIYRPCLAKGDTIPDWFPSLEEIMGDIVDEVDNLKAKLDLLVPPPTYIPPTATISLTNITYEVGTTLNDSMAVTFTKNDAGDSQGFKVYKNNTEVSNTNSYTETSVLGKEVLTFRGEVSYEPGKLKDNIFGEPDDRGAIQGGSVTTLNRTIRGEHKIFFGAGDDVIDYRTLPQEAFENSNNLILETGTTLMEFYVAVPVSRELISVVDLDALNAELVSQYVETAVQVNDAAGNPTDYRLYMMMIDTPYSTNHRHRLTFN